jgi:PKHD-type hydroxylase
MFQFSPNHSYSYDAYDLTVNWLDRSDIQQVIDYGNAQTSVDAGVGGSNTQYYQTRKSHISWIRHNDECKWLYHKMADKCRQVNNQNFRFDLWGFLEAFQYTVYDTEGSHYTWHQDEFYNRSLSRAPRKLSMVIQLSDPSEYDGGDLELNLGGHSYHTVPKGLGNLVVFPSWTLHRVTPVTKGVRKSLVAWVTGKPFV